MICVLHITQKISTIQPDFCIDHTNIDSKYSKKTCVFWWFFQLHYVTHNIWYISLTHIFYITQNYIMLLLIFLKWRWQNNQLNLYKFNISIYFLSAVMPDCVSRLIEVVSATFSRTDLLGNSSVTILPRRPFQNFYSSL